MSLVANQFPLKHELTPNFIILALTFKETPSENIRVVIREMPAVGRRWEHTCKDTVFMFVSVPLQVRHL